MRRRTAAALLGCVLAAHPAAAQVYRHLGADLSASMIRFRSTAPFGNEALSGPAAGLLLRARLGAVAIEGSYLQGHLTPDTGSAAARDLVEGTLFVVVRPKPWLALRAGPHLRAYATPGGTERWTLLEARARVDEEMIAGLLHAHLEGWIAAAAQVNVDPGASGAHGAEVGLTLYPARSPFRVRLAYGVDRATMKNGARSEALESLVLVVGFGGR